MNNSYLAHHGVKGQKWGVLRYRNADGSLTTLGKTKIKADRAKSNYKSQKLFSNERKQAKAEYKQAKKNLEVQKTKKQAPDKTVSSDYAMSRKNINSLSNDELSRAVSRLRSEEEYRKLTQKGKESANKWFTKYRDKAIDDISDAAYNEGKKRVGELLTVGLGKLKTATKVAATVAI